MSEQEPLELERGADFTPAADTRPKMPEPLPVRLVAVGDVVLPARAGIERKLDEFYVNLLQCVRDPSPDALVYRADNFRVIFELAEAPPQRDGYRILQIQVQALDETEKKLIDMEYEYQRQRGLTPGTETLLLLDPAGNWIELVEARPLF